jgi:hypothetical protein
MKLKQFLSARMTRANAAHVLMISFVICTSAGIAIIAPPVGLVSLGVCSGLYGFLLGRD